MDLLRRRGNRTDQAIGLEVIRSQKVLDSGEGRWGENRVESSQQKEKYKDNYSYRMPKILRSCAFSKIQAQSHLYYLLHGMSTIPMMLVPRLKLQL